MPRKHQPRSGSLQFWPRKRAKKLLPSVNWQVLEGKNSSKISGFICYKAGMCRALVRDLTQNSLTKNKQIVLPITIIECPPMKIFSVRFYRNNIVAKDIISENPDKELQRKLKLPKEQKKTAEELSEIEKKLGEFNDIRIVTYSLVKQTGIKKTPDIAEIGLSGSMNEKFEFVKSIINKEINIKDFFAKNQLVDVRGVTKGYGFTGTVKRFGISLRQKKSEKGQRRPGTLGPWTPSKVSFRAPLAGQHGFFTRIKYNSKIVDLNEGDSMPFEIKNYGKIRTAYILVKGSVQGPPKRQMLITAPLRSTKSSLKENFELLNLMK